MSVRPVGYRKRVILFLLLLGVGGAGLRWVAELHPRQVALRTRAQQLREERGRLAETRAQLLRFGPDGIAARNAELRSEVERREALAPAAALQNSGMEIRERFANLASRYGVHAPTFEPLPEQVDGDLRIGSLRVRATGGYDALGTWISESLSDQRLLDVDHARLEAVPDSLTRQLRVSVAGPVVAPTGAPVSPEPGQPSAAAAIELAGAAPLDAVVEFVIRWYTLDSHPASPPGAK
jgi:hypothetical protein